MRNGNDFRSVFTVAFLHFRSWHVCTHLEPMRSDKNGARSGGEGHMSYLSRETSWAQAAKNCVRCQACHHRPSSRKGHGLPDESM